MKFIFFFTQENIPRPGEGWKDPDLDICIKIPKEEEVKHENNTENTNTLTSMEALEDGQSFKKHKTECQSDSLKVV